MKQFLVIGGHGFDHQMVDQSMEVEADSPEDAVRMATKWLGHITVTVFGADRCWWATDPSGGKVAVTVVDLDWTPVIPSPVEYGIIVAAAIAILGLVVWGIVCFLQWIF